MESGVVLKVADDLLQEALDVPSAEWESITKLIAQAPDEITAIKLEKIQKSKFHTEEYLAFSL